MTSLLATTIAICVIFSCLKCGETQTTDTVIFSGITNLGEDLGTSGRSVASAQWIAIQEINNRDDILPDLQLEFQVYDAAGQSGKALVQALTIVDTEEQAVNETYFPIICGCPWSSLSTITSPALGAFGKGQISSGATSIALSDTSRYPNFYRTIPSDALQAQGIILLCQQFNWTKIGVIYINDAYGLYLSIGIVELALEQGIEATAVAFSRDEETTIQNAAQQLLHLETWIIVLIIHDADIKMVFDQFAKAGLTGYPYYFIGVDAWFDSNRIISNNVTQYAAGSIGTVPWQTDAMPLHQYEADIQPVINESLIIYSQLLTTWQQYWSDGNVESWFLERPSSTAIYGYDAMYVLAKALQKYLDDGYQVAHIENSTHILNNYIVNNQVAFVGASGNVTFDVHGDRTQGLYALGNADENGTVHYFGYFYQHGTSKNLTLSVDYSQIVWPAYFTERGIAPRSTVLTIEVIQDIHQAVLIPIYVLCGISLVMAVTLGAMTWKFHSSPVLRAASWKINLVMCSGCLSGYTAMILYGIDEHWVEAGTLFSLLCNLRLWLWIFSYTLLFMPLFFKTYRLARIFSEILEKKHLTDQRLMVGIAICLCVDLLLLVIYTSIEPLQRLYLSGGYEQIDTLQEKHIVYGSCETTNKTQYIYYALIALWKCMETLFGVYCALSVSRVGRKELNQFDETTQQLLAVAFLFIALCIALPVGALGPSSNPSFYYAVIGSLTISVGNVTIILNMAPRLYAIIKDEESAQQRFAQTPEDKLKDMIADQLRRIGIDEQWWQKATTVDQSTEVYRTVTNRSKTLSTNKRKGSTDVSGIQLAIPTQSVQSGSVATHSPDDLLSAEVEDSERDERELNKKTSNTPTLQKQQTPLTQAIELNTPQSQ